MRRTLAVSLSVGLIVGSGSWATTRVISAPNPVSAQQLEEHLNKSYQELFDLAPTLHIEESEFKRVGALLAKAEETCVGRVQSTGKADGKAAQGRSEAPPARHGRFEPAGPAGAAL